LRGFLDTNVLVSAFATRGLCADVLRHVLTEHELLTGEVVLAELRRALRESSISRLKRSRK
jgi:predicted nucleic acid-binding protein